MLNRFMVFSKASDKFIKDNRYLFWLGALIGLCLFVLIYGVYIINPAYTEWIYFSDNDLKQHFMGWCHYRNSPWHFPVGLIDTLSYPISMSTIYTDSIPIVALIFKVFSVFLPSDFQYFGIVGLLFFMLNGGTGAVLLNRFINNSHLSLLLTPFLSLSFPIIQRLFYHTALAASWIIFLCFIIWAYDSYGKDSNKQILYWGLMGVLCVGIHSYFLPMAGMILLADRICCFCACMDASPAKRILRCIYPIAAFCISAIFTLWVFGAFYGSSSGEGYGLGTFGANFNTFINPGSYGTILPEMGYENYFQYEGCGYLGLGIILLSIFVDICLISRALKKKLSLKGKLFENSPLSISVYMYVALGLFIVSFLLSTMPKISIGTLNVGTVPYPTIIYKAASIFRSNGRFIWIPMYLLIIITLVLGSRFLKEMIDNNLKISENIKNMIFYGILVVLICIQALDLSKMIKQKHESFARSDYVYQTMWDNIPEMTKGKKAFVFLNIDSDINMETAFYAYKHGMSLNNFYFARDIDDEVQAEINKYADEIRDGLIRDDTVYILKKDNEYGKEYLESLNTRILETDNNMIVVSN